jgi:hypothetical protein
VKRPVLQVAEKDWTRYLDQAGKRSEVISALAQGSSWLDVLREFHVRKGYVWESKPGWFEECSADDAGAVQVWVAKGRP